MEDGRGLVLEAFFNYYYLRGERLIWSLGVGAIVLKPKPKVLFVLFSMAAWTCDRSPQPSAVAGRMIWFEIVEESMDG